MTFYTPKKLRKNTHSLIVMALMASFGLGACGIRGSLKTPPPIWGDGVIPPAETPNQTPTDTPNNSASKP